MNLQEALAKQQKEIALLTSQIQQVSDRLHQNQAGKALVAGIH